MKSNIDNSNAVDLQKLRAKQIAMSVDGIELPIKIGDTVILSEDGIIRTVMKITISEDGKVQYMLEWFDGISTKSGWVTSAELYYIYKNLKHHHKAGF